LTTFIGVPRTAFQIAEGETRIYESSPGTRRHFCGDCGTPLLFDADRYPDEIHLYVASLDDPDAVPPQFHVHTGEQLSWFEVHDQLPRFALGSPEDEPVGMGPQNRQR